MAVTVNVGVQALSASLPGVAVTGKALVSVGVQALTASLPGVTVSGKLAASATFTNTIPGTWAVAPTQIPAVSSAEAIAIIIAGVDRTAVAFTGSLRADAQMAARGSASFELREAGTAGVYSPSLGENVEIRINGALIFYGTIDSIDHDVLGSGAVTTQRIKCIDWSRDVDRRVVTGVYPGPTNAMAILTDLYLRTFVFGDHPEAQLTAFFDVQNSPTIQGDLRFDHVPFSAALNQVTTKIGYDWFIDENRALHVKDLSSQPAAWDIADANESEVLSLKVTRTRKQYRNRQLVRVPFEVASTYVHNFTADGSRTQFFTPHYISEVLSITEDGSPKTFGRIVEDYYVGNFKDWYYQPNLTSDIQTLAPRAPVANGVAIVLTYKGPTRNVVIVEDAAEIAARKAVEGNSGAYEAVEDMRAATNAQAAEDYAQGLLDIYGTLPEVVRFTTRRAGQRPGRTVTINLSKYGINDTYLIEKVSVFTRDSKVFYEVECNSVNRTLRPWTGFFEALARKATIGPDQTTVAQAQTETPEPVSAERITFNVALDTLATGDDQTVHYLFRHAAARLFEPISVAVHLTDAPVGAALNVDLRLFDSSGVEQGSILTTPPLAVADGSTDANTTDVSALRGFHNGFMVLDVDQVGSTTPGGRLAVVVSGRII